LPTLEPILYLIKHGHSHPVLQEAANYYRSAFSPGITEINQAENDLLVDAMYGRLTAEEQARRIWKQVCSPYIYYQSRRYSRGVILKGNIEYSGKPGEQWLYPEQVDDLEHKDVVYTAYWKELSEAFEEWFNTHFDNRATLTGAPIVGKTSSFNFTLNFTLDPQSLPMFTEADERYIEVWRRQGSWGMPFLAYRDPDAPEWAQRTHRRSHTPEENEEHLRSQLKHFRSQIRFFVRVCEAIAQNPIEQPTGEYQPRKQTRLISHPRQSEQDAINEFAAKLVHSPQAVCSPRAHEIGLPRDQASAAS
jgi:hypothetical protein